MAVIKIITKGKREMFMNEKLQYAEMLEIPQSTCNITYKRAKKKRFSRRKKTDEEVKNELLEKVNSIAEESEEELSAKEIAESPENLEEYENATENEEIPTVTIRKEKKRKAVIGGFSLVTFQFILIGALIATIFLTNALVPNSGINTFFKNVFSTQKAPVIEKFSDFTPVLTVSSSENVSLDGGVMTISGEGSLYSPCDGTVTAVTQENGKYNIEIMHSEKFKTVFSGLDFAYVINGESVYKTIPVGYSKGEEVSMCFYDGKEMITDYTLNENTVVWAV